MTYIAGHKLTNAELSTLNQITNYLLANAGYLQASNCTSPKGDGRAIPLREIFPRTAQGNASIRTAEKLQKLGVLRACELEVENLMVKFAPLLMQRDKAIQETRRALSLGENEFDAQVRH